MTCLNNNDKLVIDLLRRRMETHPDEPMHYYGTPYTPAEVIEEIKRQTDEGARQTQTYIN